MSYFLIIRGPLGSGKTTVSEKLAQKLGAKHFPIDRPFDDLQIIFEEEEGYISQKSFLRANDIYIEDAIKTLNSGAPVIFEGNFYWQSQIDDLINKLNYPHWIFTLEVPLEVCIDRDKNREKSCGKDAAEVVHAKSREVNCGIPIDGTKDLNQIVEEITSHLPKN